MVKDFLIHIGYSLLALVILLLEMLLWTFFGLPYLLWTKWRYTVQCLRYPPPSGGMYSNMAQEYKNRQNKR